MKGQTYLILAIVFVIIISIFSVLNVGEVELNYLFLSRAILLILVILFSVILGSILATIVGSRKYFQVKRKKRKLQQQIKTPQKNTGANQTKPVQKEATKN